MALITENPSVRPPGDELTCLLCGIEILTLQDIKEASRDFCGLAFQEEQWKAFRGTRLHNVFVPSCEVENAYFHEWPALWGTAHRASELHSKALGIYANLHSS